MNEIAKQFDHYMENLEKESEVPSQLAMWARAFWAKLKEDYSEVSLPIAGPGGELGFQFVWNTERYYLEIDIGPNSDGFAETEWFFADREMDLSEGDEGLTEDQSRVRIMILLRRICEGVIV